MKEDNAAARALHAALGVRETGTREDVYGPGARRIVSRIERTAFERVAGRLARLGLLEQHRLPGAA